MDHCRDVIVALMGLVVVCAFFGTSGICRVIQTVFDGLSRLIRGKSSGGSRP